LAKIQKISDRTEVSIAESTGSDRPEIQEPAEINEELAKTKEALQEEIVKRRQLQEALRQAEENFELLMNYSIEAVSVIQKLKDKNNGSIASSLGKAPLVRAFIHDLKGPLALISSCAQFCIKNADLNPPLEENLKIILESGQRAGNLIKKFLELLEFQTLPVEPIKLNRLIAKTWDMARVDTRVIQVSFVADWDPSEPKIQGNTEGLERLFYNLFMNAVQAASKEGKVTATTRFLPAEKAVEAVITDNGPGIPPELRHKIFSPFFTTKEDGTGLGLVICLSIVQQHLGTIQVDPAPGGGTKVSVRLPAL
jgi:signal transduction histidine kinase